MNQTLKLILDLLFGAAIPIAILNYLTQPLGAPVAYVVAALVPVGWVAVDLLFITRSFNYITSYIGLSAIVSGALAFWFVDGWLFALKDTAGHILGLVVFAGSILIGKPMIRYFFAQVVKPDSPERHAELDDLLSEADVHRALVLATLIIVGLNLVLGAVNLWLNLTTVVAAFGTEAFNQQVAHVNGITRVLFPLPTIIGFSVAIFMTYRAVFRHLPVEEGRSPFESDFWELMARRKAAAGADGG